MTHETPYLLLRRARLRQVFRLDWGMPFRLFACASLVALSALPASAQRLPATVTPDHYDLSFVVDLAHERFDGTETIRVTVAEPTSRVVLNAVDLDLRDVTIGAGTSSAGQVKVLSCVEPTIRFVFPAGSGPIVWLYGLEPLATWK